MMKYCSSFERRMRLRAITGAVLFGMTSVHDAHAGLLFDNLSAVENALPGAGAAYVADGTSDDTFVGGIYNLPAGTTDITGFDLDVQNGTSLAITYLQLNIYVWGTVNTTSSITAANPVFSHLLGQTSVDSNFPPGVFLPGINSPFETGSPGTSPAVDFPTPLALPAGDTTIGLTFNFKISTDGINYSSAAGLTSMISYGIPPTTGTGTYGFFLNSSGETNGNFIEPSTTFGYADELMSTRIFGDIAPGIPALWKVSSGGNWNSAANWSPATVPTSASDAFFNLSSASNYTVALPAAEMVQDLYVQNDNVTLSLNTSTSLLTIGGMLDVGIPPASGARVTGILVLNHSSGTSSGNVSAGSVNLGGNGSTGALTVSSGINLIITQSVAVGAGSVLTIKPNGKLTTPAISIAGNLGAWTGKVDICSGSLDLAGGFFATVDDQVTQGYNASGGGNWLGNGITSSTAAADTTRLTAVGVILNNAGGGRIYGSGTPLGLFNGTNPGLYDVLLKYTFYGDANLDGKVDGSDYSLIDSTYANEDFEDGTAFNPISGWYNGDFNYDGIVDGSDYALIDNVFNLQGSTFSEQIAFPTTVIATAGHTNVPEPSVAYGLCMSFIALLLRRDRRTPNGFPG